MRGFAAISHHRHCPRTRAGIVALLALAFVADASGSAARADSPAAAGQVYAFGKNDSGQIGKAAGKATITLKLTAKGVRLLEHAKRLKLTARSTFAARGTHAVSRSKTFTLTR